VFLYAPESAALLSAAVRVDASPNPIR
jgi:hypothetical protein